MPVLCKTGMGRGVEPTEINDADIRSRESGSDTSSSCYTTDYEACWDQHSCKIVNAKAAPAMNIY